MKQKTPQEKKALSYAKDRRNSYGENDKASRKSITLRKAKQNRAFRKTTNQILERVVSETDVEKLEILENEMRCVKKGSWKKYPDIPLGDYVESRLEGQEERTGKGKTALKKIREIIENLEIEVKKETDNRWIARATNLSNITAVGDSSEGAVKILKYAAEAVLKNEMGFDIRILINGKVIKPTL
jgi:predicted RNase H-like HicB family nuclease